MYCDCTYVNTCQSESWILKFSIFFPMFTKILPKLSKISLVLSFVDVELFLAIEIKSFPILIIVILEFFHSSFADFNSDNPSDILPFMKFWEADERCESTEVKFSCDLTSLINWLKLI